MHGIHPKLEHLAVEVSLLHADERNARRHPRSQLRQIAESLREHGQRKPFVGQRRGGRIVIRAGNGGLAAARDLLGWSHVAVLVVDEEDEDAIRYALRDNRTAELSGWDDDVLAELLEGLDYAEGLGWDSEELAAMVPASPEIADLVGDDGGLGAGDGDGDEDEQGIPNPEPPAESRARAGDLWRLGSHVLAVCDSLSPENLALALEATGEERAAAVFTDPPYAIFGSSTGIAEDIADDKAIRPMFRTIIRQIVRALRPFGHAYICCDWRSWASIWAEAAPNGLRPKNCIVWDKGSGLGSMFGNAHEFLFFGSARPGKRYMREKISGERTVLGMNVWRVNRASGSELQTTSEGHRAHNAQKPAELVRRALDASTDAEELVVDLFGGSGTTLAVCEEKGRRCLTFEIAPGYADVAIERWERMTGAAARVERGYFATGEHAEEADHDDP